MTPTRSTNPIRSAQLALEQLDSGLLRSALARLKPGARVIVAGGLLKQLEIEKAAADVRTEAVAQSQLDFALEFEGETALRRRLARSEWLRDLCRRSRPKLWERLEPTPDLIARETARFDRIWAQRRAREARKAVHA
jgi:hypothetical protein